MSHELVPPSESQLSTFRESEWKERRKLQALRGPGDVRILRKHFPDRDAIDGELHHLSLVRSVSPEWVPEVYGVEAAYIDLEYIQGIRVFNTLQHLNDISLQDPNALVVKERLLDRCMTETCRLQQVLRNDIHSYDRVCYPVERKILGTLQLIDHCLSLGLPLGTIQSELAVAENYLRELSCPVPFRDATPKNLILAWSEIRMENAGSYAKQREMIREAVEMCSRGAESPLERHRIVHVDFSSCNEWTVPEDDPISLLVHESSWRPEHAEASRLLWLDVEPDPLRLAVGMLVRMYRFGGRRLAYRLVHGNGHRARYGNESCEFYFDRLVDEMSPFHSDLKSHFPAILRATEAILERLNEGIYPREDWFEATYGSHRDRYYRDVYPH